MFSHKPYLRVFLNAAFILVMMVALMPITNTVAATAKDDSKASPSLEWTLEAELTLPASEVATRGAGGAKAAMIDPLVNRLQSAGVQVEVQMLAELEAGVPCVFKASGKGTLDDFRNIINTVIRPEFNLLGGVTEIVINAGALQSSSVDLTIDTNPSTGFAWLVADDSGMKESAPASYKRKGIGVGMPEKQTLHLQVSGVAARAVKLVYKRPWESAPATRRLTLKLSILPASFDLSDPTPVPVESDLFQGTTAADETTTVEPATPVISLPSSFDWRTAGKVTDIRNQSSCGSCWAFATVGVMESALLRANNTSTNLSEQFLVSCNKDSWSCSGGFAAHKYHYDTLGKLQSTVGAVLESDFPYTATNATCKAVSNHPYTLSNWTTISTSPNIATTDQIKQAIYDHGVVTSGVCVGYSFRYYTGDIFNTDEKSSCYYGAPYNNYYANHLIDLVGWDDAGQYFILRNSWDTSWGDNGYMRIHYGISLIGQYVTWATALPTLTVTKSGTGIGTVTSSPSGIDCGSTCTASYAKGTKVALTPVPDSGSIFTRWSGDCNGTGPCKVTMSADKSVEAVFDTGSCTYTISPKSKALTYKGGAITIGITAKGSTYCPAPDISKDGDWISLTSTFAKTRGKVQLTIPEYDSSILRTGTVTIGEKTFTITQAGKPCTLALSASSSALFSKAGGAGSFTVTATPADCAWTAKPAKTSTWVAISSGATGTGTGDVAYTVDANTGKVARNGKITVVTTLNKKSKSYMVKQSNK